MADLLGKRRGEPPGSLAAWMGRRALRTWKHQVIAVLGIGVGSLPVLLALTVLFMAADVAKWPVLTRVADLALIAVVVVELLLVLNTAALLNQYALDIDAVDEALTDAAGRRGGEVGGIARLTLVFTGALSMFVGGVALVAVLLSGIVWLVAGGWGLVAAAIVPVIAIYGEQTLVRRYDRSIAATLVDWTEDLLVKVTSPSTRGRKVIKTSGDIATVGLTLVFSDPRIVSPG